MDRTKLREMLQYNLRWLQYHKRPRNKYAFKNMLRFAYEVDLIELDEYESANYNTKFMLKEEGVDL